MLEDAAHGEARRAATAAISAKTILVATGSHPMIPEFPGAEHLISSNECFQLEQLPEQHRHCRRRLYRHGVRLDLRRARRHGHRALSRRSDLARFRHAICATGLAEAMRNRGIDLRMDTDMASLEKEGEGYRVHLKRGDSIAAGLVMAATGRVPNTSGLGLEQARRRAWLERADRRR